MRRDDILKRFRHDDEPSLRGVLRDLTDSGLVFSSGAASNLSFRAATKDEASTLRRGGDSLGLEAFVWSSIYREADIGLEALSERTALSAAELAPVVESLVASGKVERSGSGDSQQLRSSQLVLGFDDDGLGKLRARSLHGAGSNRDSQAFAGSARQTPR